MIEPQLVPSDGGEAILTRTAVIARIEDRLAGRLDDAALAAWAFDHFYAEELGQEHYEDSPASAYARH